MLVSVRRLLQTNKKFFKMGNHRKFTDDDGYTYYFYHDTAILQIAPDGRRIYDNGGYNTASTNRVINDYRRYFNDMPLVNSKIVGDVLRWEATQREKTTTKAKENTT